MSSRLNNSDVDKQPLITSDKTLVLLKINSNTGTFEGRTKEDVGSISSKQTFVSIHISTAAKLHSNRK